MKLTGKKNLADEDTSSYEPGATEISQAQQGSMELIGKKSLAMTARLVSSDQL